MKNELEIYAYLDKKNSNRLTVDENIFYGNDYANCEAHGLRIAGEGKYTNIRVRVDIEKYFDYIAKNIPEKYRTNRIRNWLNGASE